MEAVETLLGVCDVCKELMEDARILPCFHSFCLKCLEISVVPHESSKCPTCEVDFQLPQGGLKNLRKNAFIEYLVSLKRVSVVCDSCNENQAAKFCIECAFNYCSSCLVYHERIPTSRHHNLQSSRSSVSDHKYPIFREHSELDNLFCKDCDLVLCGRHLASKHNSCEMINVSDYLSSVKARLGRNIKKIKIMIKNVETNYKSSEDRLSCNNMKASNLKKEIRERGEELKKAVDSYVAGLVKHVDEELKRHQDEAGDVMKALKNMKATLSAQVETLKEQLITLNYKNIVERSSSTVAWNEIVPKYSENFRVSLSSGFEGQRVNLEKSLGTLKKEPKFRFIKEVSLSSPYKSLAASRDEIFACDSNKSEVDVLSHDGLICKRSFNFKNELSNVTDLLLINSKLYISGRCCDSQDVVKVIKVDTASACEPMVISRLQYGEYFLRLTKSICGNLLVVLKNKILHLTEDGVVTRTVTLASDIYDALQLDDGRYVVCCPNEAVFIVDDRGEMVAQRSPSEGRDWTTPFRLAKDDFGNIYVGDFNHVVSVLDYDLKVVSCHIFDHSVHKMSYCGDINALFVLTKKQELFSFEL